MSVNAPVSGEIGHIDNVGRAPPVPEDRTLDMTNRLERQILRAALVELAAPDGPPSGSAAAALDAGVGRELVEVAMAHNLTAPLRDVLVEHSWDGDMARLDAPSRRR